MKFRRHCFHSNKDHTVLLEMIMKDLIGEHRQRLEAGRREGDVTLGDHCHRHTPSHCTMLCYDVTTSHFTRFCYNIILNALHCFTINVLEHSFHRLSKCTAALGMREVATLQMKLTNMRAQRHGFGYPLFLFIVEKTTVPHLNCLIFLPSHN